MPRIERIGCRLGGAVILGVLLTRAAAALASIPPPIEVGLELGRDLRPGGLTTVTATLTSRASLTGATLTWTLEGVEASGQGLTAPLGNLAAGMTRALALSVVLPSAGRGRIRVEVAATRPDGGRMVAVRSALYLLADGDQVHVDVRSFSSIERELLRARLRDAGGDPAVAYAVEHLLGAGATESAEGPAAPTPRGLRDDALVARATGAKADSPRLAAGMVTVRGQIRWFDESPGIGVPPRSGLHFMPFVKIDINDDEGDHSDTVKTIFADADGNYTATIDNNDGDGTGRDIFIRAFAETERGSHVDDGIGVAGSIYFIDSTVHRDVADGATLNIDLAANNSDDNSIAFGILNAALEGELFVLELTGSYPDAADINYPYAGLTSAYNELFNSLNINHADAFSWDRIQHEYGHFLADLNDIANSPGGSHEIGEHLAESYRKDKGVRLAWSEGLAHFLSILIQLSRNEAALDIPNVGTRVMSATIVDNLDLEGSASPPTSDGGAEDREETTARVLYDLYDRGRDGRDQLALGAVAVWRTLVGASPQMATLSDAWNAFAAGQPVDYLTKLGGIFADHSVAPDPTDPPDGAIVDDHTVFKWFARGGGPSYPLNRFRVQFWSPDFATLRFEKTGLTSPMYDPTPAERQTIRGLGPVKWLVRGLNEALPEVPTTGEYVSPARSLQGVRLGFVIDDTGSMGEEIGGVKAALTEFVGSLASEPTPPGIGVVTFKDSPTLHVATNNLATIQATVDGLFADGGDDCPEAAAEALAVAGGTVQPGGVVFFSTDADPHPGSDIAGAIALLRAQRIRVNVLLSGSCTESVATLAATSGSCLSAGCQTGKPRTASPAPLAGTSLDDYGDSAAEATSVLPSDAPLIGMIAPAGDVDWVRFPAAAGTSYRIATEGSDFDTVLTLYDTDGTTQLAFDDDGGGDRTSLLFFTPSAPGTYFVALAGFGGHTGAFQLVIEPSGDAHGPLGAIQAFSQVASETGGVFAFLPGVNTTADDARRYRSAARDIMAGSVGPSVPLVEPATAPQGAALVLTVHGLNTNFSAGSTIAFAASGITAGAPIARSSTILEVPVQVTAGAPVGFSDVTVTTPLGAATEHATGHDALRVTAPPAGPSLTAVTPSMLTLGTTTDVRVFGVNTHFDATSTIGLGSGVTIGALAATSPTELRASVTVGTDPSALGFHDVSVTTGNEVATESVPGPLLVVRQLAAGIPRLTTVTPREGRPGQTLALHVTGENTHFTDGSAAELSASGVTVVATHVLGPTVLDLDVQIAPAAALGFRDLTIRTGGEMATGLGIFAVTLETSATPGITTTTLPAAGCTGAADCNDDDPCTRDACVAGRCMAEAATGFDGVLCAFDRSLAVPACGGQVPAVVGNKFAKARALVVKANSAKPKKGQKLLKQAQAMLRAAVKAIGKAERKKKGHLSADCAAGLRAVLTGAQSRVATFRF